MSSIYRQRAKMARFCDVDENDCINWVNAVGAVIFGHAEDAVDRA